MSLHAKIANDIELDERFHALFEKCCRSPPPNAPPAAPLTPERIRARVRERAANRVEEASGPTIRRPTRPCKPVTPPARQARVSMAPNNKPRIPPVRRAVLIQAPPATAAISRPQRTAGSPIPSRITQPELQPAPTPPTTVSPPPPRRADHRPPKQPADRPPVSHATAASIPTTPTTKVKVPGGEILEVSTRIIREVRRYRARAPNGHWILRWDHAGNLTLARFAQKRDNP